MASGAFGDSNEDLNSRTRFRWPEDRKVYTRRSHKKKSPKACNGNGNAVSVDDKPSSTALTPSPHINEDSTSTTVPGAGAALVEGFTTASNSVAPNNCESVSANGGAVETVVSGRAEGDDVAQVSPKAAQDVTTDEGLQQRQEECLSRQLSVNDGASALQQMQEERSEYNGHSTQTGAVEEGSRGPIAEQQNHLGNSSTSKSSECQNLSNSPPKSNEAQNLQSPLPHLTANEILLGSGDENENTRDKSLLSRESDRMDDSREVTTPQPPYCDEAKNDGDEIMGSPQVPEGNGILRPLVVSKIHDRIRFNLCKATSKNDIRNFRDQLECELDQVRKLFVELDSNEHQSAAYSTQNRGSDIISPSNLIGAGGTDISGYGQPQPKSQPQHMQENNVVDRRYLLKMNSEAINMGHEETRPTSLPRVNSDVGGSRNLEPRPYSRQLSVMVMENNHLGSDFFEKEKRTPKANQYYRNSEFLLGKDRLPSESNKRLKANNGRKHNGETGPAFGFGFDRNRNQVFKSCSSLLQRLMKHKYGWVFNEPVDAQALGLFDYHDIIKHPMDLGTIKTRLAQNWYKSPREFAEDVRLVFDNAMTYNPKGQDVHVMAEQLLQIFEERWAIIETENARSWKHPIYQDGGLSTPSFRKTAAHSPFTSAVVAGPPNPGFVPASLSAQTYISAPPAASGPLYAPAAHPIRNIDRLEPALPMPSDLKIQRPHVGRAPAPKKPKAKDPDKRDMTYDEKQRLSTNLQGLPSEKLDAIVQIIKKRNTALSQHDDEIEVDIDRVDAETLWELDRFVTNYKKSLSKNKRKAELALQARMAAKQNAGLTNITPAAAEAQTRGGAEKSIAPADGDKQGYDRSRSSSSSSSSSDSGSSSTDSDSDSSSADGSDAGQSPRA
ncbi:transcription factor GTE4-like [Andrographis paniculata]|uniref:transcription factor GTE4-like n=1 Tax=Andrographis paniculata TaxID=175694 RepID=UPI0021E95B2C|nr:transcription factor GTE4-like [Andrographis paniculata]